MGPRWRVVPGIRGSLGAGAGFAGWVGVRGIVSVVVKSGSVWVSGSMAPKARSILVLSVASSRRSSMVNYYYINLHFSSSF